jgi:hypothetical protein
VKGYLKLDKILDKPEEKVENKDSNLRRLYLETLGRIFDECFSVIADGIVRRVGPPVCRRVLQPGQFGKPDLPFYSAGYGKD